MCDFPTSCHRTTIPNEIIGLGSDAGHSTSVHNQLSIGRLRRGRPRPSALGEYGPSRRLALVIALLVHGDIAGSLSSRLNQACAGTDTATCLSLQIQLGDMYLATAPYLGYLAITTVLIATFWGAPLISREIESGTAALAWCQSITRQR